VPEITKVTEAARAKNTQRIIEVSRLHAWKLRAN